MLFCELNSKRYGLLTEPGTPIPENADLNDYFNPGIYSVSNNTVAITLKNYPPDLSVGCKMIVNQHPSSWKHQIIFPNNSADIYTRCAATDAWHKITAQQL